METRLPDGIACRYGVAQVREHDGTVWLLAEPELLGWPQQITWLFSPVVGRKWPGDLWGVDARGEVLVVENKLQSSRAVDPFEDFVNASTFSRNLKVPELAKHWRKLLTNELKCPPGVLPPSGTWRGVLPYSNHREAPLRWRELYRGIKRSVGTPPYKVAALRNLTTRAIRGEPAPHFVGVATLSHGGQPRLSSLGHEHWRELVREVGRRHVHAVAVRAVQSGRRRVRIERVPWTVKRYVETP